jgi:hypothetical protein
VGNATIVFNSDSYLERKCQENNNGTSNGPVLNHRVMVLQQSILTWENLKIEKEKFHFGSTDPESSRNDSQNHLKSVSWVPV